MRIFCLQQHSNRLNVSSSTINNIGGDLFRCCKKTSLWSRAYLVKRPLIHRSQCRTLQIDLLNIGRSVNSVMTCLLGLPRIFLITLTLLPSTLQPKKLFGWRIYQQPQTLSRSSIYNPTSRCLHLKRIFLPTEMHSLQENLIKLKKSCYFVVFRDLKNCVCWEEIQPSAYALLSCFQQGATLQEASIHLDASNEVEIPFWFQKWTYLNWFCKK